MLLNGYPLKREELKGEFEETVVSTILRQTGELQKAVYNVSVCWFLIFLSLSQMSNVKKTFIGGAICRIWVFESETLAAEEMLDRVICSREQFSFQMCLESGDGSGTFRN